MQRLSYTQARELFDCVISDKELTRAQVLATAIAMMSHQVAPDALHMFMGYVEGFMGIVLSARDNQK